MGSSACSSSVFEYKQDVNTPSTSVCLLVHYAKKTFFEAYDFCRMHNAMMMSITSDDIHDAMIAAKTILMDAGVERYWMGLSKARWNWYDSE